VRRRAFLGILGNAAVSWPLVVRAQSERVRRIGMLMPFPPTNAEMQARTRAFRDELTAGAAIKKSPARHTGPRQRVM